MKKYDFKTIEKKWQEIWEKSKDKNHGIDFDKKPKHYNLVEFPYPSGAGIHVGHCMGYGASDAYSRMKRMQGYNVIYPMGWDAFGLPTENYAIKTGKKPSDVTKENIETFRSQMKALGYSFDWEREINTTDPDYYKWTQWIFLQFYKHGIVKGKLVEVADDDTLTPRLAYQQEMPINWCPSCKIGLANEEVIAGKCERCGAETVRRMQKQWMLRITAYADRLIDDLKTVEYLPKIATQQINWIGRSEGANIKFEIRSTKSETNSKFEALNPKQYLNVFTTRADTLFGATFMVVAPEHEIISKIKNQISNIEEVEKYIDNARKKSDLERTEFAKEKTGVGIKGIKAINPINGTKIPIFIADYVLATYGTGAIMAVPAHDERDYEFAKKYNIPIIEVIIPTVTDKHDPPREGVETIFRNAIQAIVINPKNKKVLMLKWKKFPWTTFISGGIDDDEDRVAAAKREILEETGYKNVKFIKYLGGPVDSNFYANHKGANRKAHFWGMVFELVDEERNNISENEQAIHEIEWMTWDEIDKDNNVKCAEYDIWLERMKDDTQLFADCGVLINSGEFDGMGSKEAAKAIIEKLEEENAGKFAVSYKLRDWLFSRQHYWGEPIPIVYCKNCAINYRKSEIINPKFEKNRNITDINNKEYAIVPVPEKDLPIVLPDVEKYQPTDTGESPLASIKDWVNVKCPKCGADARRETDTMPNWAGSSWYYAAYAINQKSKIKNQNFGNLFKKYKDELKYWLPVDLYNGGMEHTTLHLLYSRFWHKFLYDLGCFSTPEPYKKRIAHGIILGTDNRKMSKSFGNVINPDDIIDKYGADTLRAYMMFIGPYDQESSWNMNGVSGVYRFINKLWTNSQKISEDADDKLVSDLQKTIKGVTHDLENYLMNTYIAKLMEFNNRFSAIGKIGKETFATYLLLISPAMPHLAEELWAGMGYDKSIFESTWPKFDERKIRDETIEIVIQINGKVRDKLNVAANISDDELKKIALKSERVKKYTNGVAPKKIIVVPGKLVSLVV
jgi:leucyl-tRNA synthetase